ncbi:hypothetical protein [Xanthomonas sp. 10-10]|uniref:Uncharacterized protein n=1 Tax=Xanthomonas sp. 10-10 TaxID=3115848 RepID=A0AAU7P5H0_9XANT
MSIETRTSIGCGEIRLAMRATSLWQATHVAAVTGRLADPIDLAYRRLSSIRAVAQCMTCSRLRRALDCHRSQHRSSFHTSLRSLVTSHSADCIRRIGCIRIKWPGARSSHCIDASKPSDSAAGLPSRQKRICAQCSAFHAIKQAAR